MGQQFDEGAEKLTLKYCHAPLARRVKREIIMSYGNDMIVADTDAMEAFLTIANGAKDELGVQIRQIDRKYRALVDWDDVIQKKTGEVLDIIEKQADLLSDEIEKLNRNFSMLIDDLKDYNNPHLGKFGRL